VAAHRQRGQGNRFPAGTLEEKLIPGMQPIHDALELLSDMNMGHEHRRSGDLIAPAASSSRPSATSATEHRQSVHVIDEAQNLTPLEAKTIITRVGPAPSSSSRAIPTRLTILH